jgi:hypothetical protein
MPEVASGQFIILLPVASKEKYQGFLHIQDLIAKSLLIFINSVLSICPQPE